MALCDGEQQTGIGRQVRTFHVRRACAGNHGQPRVHGMFHFAYADGTPFIPIGTTCYNWANESDELPAQTIATLKTSPFNKVRMCILPTRQSAP